MAGADPYWPAEVGAPDRPAGSCTVDELLAKDDDITTAELHRAVSIHRRAMKRI